ncbi:MAG: V-type ATPase 116kDa subunit family protein [Pseudomonadota bacterium]|nr:V-type ATPase 116kDa subunit family protein [Pseudomonadota bacterium]
MLRPASTRWFEVLCPRAESVRAVAELARTGSVEVEVRSGEEEDFPVQHLAEGLVMYGKLLPRYGRYWERGRLRRSTLVEAPTVVLARALARIEAWRREADPLIDALQDCEEELVRLKWVARVIEHIEESPLDFSLVAECGPLLASFCAVVPKAADPRLPDWVISRSVLWQDERCHMILGPADRLEQVKQQVKSVKGRIIERPGWLRGNAGEALRRIAARRQFLSTRLVHLYAGLDTLFEDYSLGDVLGEVAWLDWFAKQVGGLELASSHLVWITGWTDDLTGHSLARALHRSGTRTLMRFAPPARGSRAPQILDNPVWLRPFEVFARAFGVPGSDEVDPTPVLAVVVPLLFGYMFGDVGQGLVLLALGWWLQGRFEIARLLLSGGASAVVFGFLFGSLFAREDLIPALWLHPMGEPLIVLAVPLVFAVLLLSLGQLLSGLGALWRGELGRWLLVDAGFLVLYLGLIGLVTGLDLGWLTLVGIGWYLIGSFIVDRRLVGALAALGHLAEGGLQILVNTLSFARVGAFALAHASLSAAVVTMADATGTLFGMLLIMILGNLLIIALEGLVVSIQTTRLVLFEFFNRFLRGSGRVFRPLPEPPALVSGEAT